MLFNSYSFILLFLPLTTAVFHLLRGRGLERLAFGWLAVASLGFYGWWSVRGLALLVGLIFANFAFARWLIVRRGKPYSRSVLALAIAFNLGILGYFKYFNFFVATADQFTSASLPFARVVLPLGISFFTFQKIALLVDCQAGKVSQLGFLDYALFVAFFPQLIAGPITHHSEVMPQFRARQPVTQALAAQALAIFTLGLAKKVLLADTLAKFATPVFEGAAQGRAVGFVDGWTGALAYTLQLYFDFSGYSEMAIGCALLFGVRLPLNFASPYKATSIIEFWRRWHMTLSRFLRDYLYIPLGGNRKGEMRRYTNLMVTMLLGGLWHGAGWTFVIWGALHGAFLTLNHLWRGLRRHEPAGVEVALGAVLTFICVVAGWVIFRSQDLLAALRVLQGMAGLRGVERQPVELATAAPLLGVLLALAWLAPNTQELTGYMFERQPLGVSAFAPGRWLALRAATTGAVFALAFLSLSKVSEFLYFQF